TDFDKGTDDVSVVREHKEEVIVEEKHETEKVFTVVEQMPEFPGGTSALYEYLSKNIRYPEQAAQNDIQGRVTVQFVVEKDGSIGEVKVVRSKDPDLDKEAVRVVKSLPKFVPGKMNGQSVRVWFTLPITFKLNN
ncbi:MAG: energy transducer TonB, partial [Muribaculaceae bacterium]|nr:energy transducer TonB [Muribaculaceae bacterium]